MRDLRNALKLLASLSAGSLIVLSTSGFAAAAQCYQAQGQGGCRTASELAELGIAAVKFKPAGFIRSDFSTGWQLVAQEAESRTARAVFAPLSNDADPVVGEEGAMALQEALCKDLRAAGIACTRDYVAGSWQVPQAPRGAFSVKFETTSTAPLAANGKVGTKQLACQKTSADGIAVAAEIACKAKYMTSLRLIYLANDTYVNLSGMSCAESGATVALSEPSALPACPTDGVYASAQWSPFGRPSFRLRFANEARLTSVDAQISFYAGSW